MAMKIVVPLDMSEISETALPLAQALAGETGLQTILVSVVDVPDEFMSWVRDSSASEEHAEQQDRLKKYLEGKAANFTSEVETVILEGRPAQQLVQYVDQIESPIVMMASHGRTGFKRLTVGSVTARVVHSIDCPVVVTRASNPDAPTRQVDWISTVLVPLDGSAFAEKALQTADALLGDIEGIEFHLLRIPESVSWQATPYGGVADYQAIEMYMEAVHSESTDYLKKVAAELESRGRKVSWEVAEGLVSDTIHEVADRTNADLIAMSSHGRTGFRRFFMGSVAERVLNEAAVPVMMIGPGMVEDDE